MSSLNNEVWLKSLLPLEATAAQLICRLCETAMQIVLVIAIAHDGVLLGTVTAGDTRRGLLRWLNMSSSMGEIMQKSTFAVSSNVNQKTILNGVGVYGYPAKVMEK